MPSDQASRLARGRGTPRFAEGIECQTRNNPGLGVMPQIVDARRVVGAAVDPAQVGTQLGEDLVDLVQADALAEQAAARADEERRVVAS